jgi:hypothetical protein
MSRQSHRSPLWYLVGILLVGIVAWWVVKLLLGLVFYVMVGVIVVGGVMYLARKSKGSLRDAGHRKIGR